MRIFVATLALAFALALSGACGTTSKQRRTTPGQVIGGVVVAVGAFAALGLLYGLIDCAEKSGGACSIPIGSNEVEEPQLPQK